MKISIKGIIEGVWNSIFIKEEIERIANERLSICRGCSFNSDHQKKYNKYKTFRPDFHCTDCTCNLHAKTRSLSEACPQGKWGAEMTEEEEFDLTKKLEDEQDNKDR